MRSIVRLSAAVTFVACVLLMGGGTTAPDVAVAQSRGAIMVTRVYTGSDGLAYAEEVEMPANTAGRYDDVEVTGVQFSSRPPSTGGDWHNGPRRQYVITLKGSGELELSGGQKVAVGPGHINLIEDTTGKGHITRNLGPENRLVLTLVLADQALADAPGR